MLGQNGTSPILAHVELRDPALHPVVTTRTQKPVAGIKSADGGLVPPHTGAVFC